MRPSVLGPFMVMTGQFEGGMNTNFMYLDILGLVTGPFGMLIDSPTAALGLAWKRPDGTLASSAEVIAEWERVKARTDLRLRGGMIFKSVTTLRLDEAGVQQAFDATLRRMVAAMRSAFLGWDDLPADAQMACLSMAWAVGPGWPAKFPRCAAAVRVRDFLTAEQECHIQDAKNPGVRPRNAANKLCFRNAHTVDDLRLDAETLWWPHEVNGEPLRPVVDEVLTEDETTPVVGTRIVDFDVVTRLPGSIANDDDPGDAA